MLRSIAKYLAAAITGISLLSSCSSTQPTSPPTLAAPAVKRQKTCPCLFVSLAYTPKYPQGAVAVFSAGASGDATPLQYIAGGHTTLQTPSDVAVDSSGDLYVADYHNESVSVFASGATGNVAPIRTITGAQTGLASPFGVAIDPVNGNLYVTNREGGSSSSGSITFYAPGANGNVAPLGTIQGADTGLANPASPAFDPKGQLYVPNLTGNSITVYRSGVTGDAAPVATIAGAATGLQHPYQVTLDSKLNVYAANFWPPISITVYAADSKGNVKPLRTIAGRKTKLNGPDGVAVDSRDRIYGANYTGNSLTVYLPGASGNATPSRTIAGQRTGIVCPSGIVLR
jgi:6-phosphogluconolactonase (cycloisomerase 2 family)